MIKTLIILLSMMGCNLSDDPAFNQDEGKDTSSATLTKKDSGVKDQKNNFRNPDVRNVDFYTPDSGLQDQTKMDICVLRDPEVFCGDREARCGTIDVIDCEKDRTVQCGDCPDFFECLNNQCECKKESADKLCAIKGLACGNATIKNKCDMDQKIECGKCETKSFCEKNACVSDRDGDLVRDTLDNCPDNDNPSQQNSDSDLLGDKCDNCPTKVNHSQADGDNDGVGDVCDNCIIVANTDQKDTDGDGVGELCDNCPKKSNVNQVDSDGDGVGDLCDNCRLQKNPNQSDRDNDGIGDSCDFLCDCSVAQCNNQICRENGRVGECHNGMCLDL